MLLAQGSRIAYILRARLGATAEALRRYEKFGWHQAETPFPKLEDYGLLGEESLTAMICALLTMPGPLARISNSLIF